MRELRIAMVCDIVPGQAGGSYLSTVRFATLLRARGHHVILIGSRDRTQPPVKEYRGIPIYQFPAIATPGSHRLYFQSFPTARALRKIFIAEKIQIVHIMFPSYSCAVAKRVARSLGLSLVAHVHTQPENIYNFLPSILRRPFVFNGILNFLVRFVTGADRVLFPSELGREVYTAMNPALPAAVLSNGVDLTHFHAVDTSAFYETYRLDPSHTYLLFVGRLMEDKDPGLMIKALRELRTSVPLAHALFVGDGPLRVSLEALAKASGQSDRVTFLGKISDEDLLAAYSASSVFVLPSTVELEGMVVLEAMACGKPIVIADAPTSASRFFVRDNGALFTPGDAHDLATKLTTVLSDPVRYQKLATQSLANVRAYDIRTSVARLEGYYTELVDRPATSS